MSNRISYDQATKQSARMLAQAVNSVKEGVEAINRIGEVLNAASFGNPADWQGVANETGCPLANAQDLWTLVATARDKLNDPAIATMIARLDQG